MKKDNEDFRSRYEKKLKEQGIAPWGARLPLALADEFRELARLAREGKLKKSRLKELIAEINA